MRIFLVKCILCTWLYLVSHLQCSTLSKLVHFVYFRLLGFYVSSNLCTPGGICFVNYHHLPANHFSTIDQITMKPELTCLTQFLTKSTHQIVSKSSSPLQNYSRIKCILKIISWSTKLFHIRALKRGESRFNSNCIPLANAYWCKVQNWRVKHKTESLSFSF